MVAGASVWIGESSIK
ncbi:hypothetical protein B4U80_04271 [Leptotrombidium deliense]|uniref:Uncharacterized protein n=1 Tax=Leptotrombidium deliense TaxID=299467 RepID=A0A443RZ90_9ACAR|nr:hypothetical protein B4U80_04271 [Leptotrombidium deliense]